MKIQRLVFPEKLRCEVEEAELDEKLGPGEVLIQNEASLVSVGTEMSMFTATHAGVPDPKNAWAKFPFRPGYGAVGTILAGSGEWKPGMRVLNRGPHATATKVKAETLVAVPDGLTAERAVFHRLVEVALTAPRLAPAQPNQKAVVIGLGIVGNLCAQLYQFLGASFVAAADLSARRLAMAKECGVARPWDVSAKPLAEWIQAEMPRSAPDLIVEATGSPAVFVQSMALVARLGRVFMLGSPRGKIEIEAYADLFRRNVTLIGGHESGVAGPVRKTDRPLMMEWLRDEKVRVAPLISHRVTLAEAAKDVYTGLHARPEEYMGIVLKLA